MKYLIVLLLLLVASPVLAPTSLYQPEWVEMKARVTCYSPLQRGEKKVNHRKQSVRNENGIAVPKNTLPDGTEVWIKGAGMRVVDDRIPGKSVRKLERRYPNAEIIIDARWYDSLNRNKSINKQLYKRDMGVTTIWVRVR